MELNDLRDQSYDVGRVAHFFTDPAWDGTTNLFAADGPLEYLGATMGEFRWTPNAEYQELTVPELLGPAALKRYLTGTRPTATFRGFPTLAFMRAVSPIGVASLGHERQRLAKTFTIFSVPEALLLKPDANGFMKKVPLVLTAGVWLKDGVALTTAEEELLYLSSLAWKVDCTPATPLYRWEEGGRSDIELELVAQTDLDRPEGCNQVLHLGEVFEEYGAFAGLIDFEPV